MSVKFKLPGGKEVVLKELNIADEMASYRVIGGTEPNPMAQNAAVALEFIRRCLASVGGKTLTYDDVDGDKLYALFTGKEMKLVQAAFGKVNAKPTDEETADFFESMVTIP